MKVNTSSFTRNLPARICIARIRPAGLEIPHLKLLAPSSELLMDYKYNTIDWNGYERRYWSEIADRCKGSHAIWNGAKAFIDAGRADSLRQGCLIFVLESAARTLGTQTLTLCCYEGRNEPRCHRRLIYRTLPENMKGLSL